MLLSAKPFATASGPLKRYGSSWPDVSIRALTQVEDILSLCCELWLDKQQEFNIYYLVTCTVNVFWQLHANATHLRNLPLKVTFQLNAKNTHFRRYVHMKFSYVLMWTHSWSLSKHLDSPCMYCLGRLTRNDHIQARTTLFNATLKVGVTANVEMGLLDWFTKFLRKNPEWCKVVEKKLDWLFIILTWPRFPGGILARTYYYYYFAEKGKCVLCYTDDVT